MLTRDLAAMLEAKPLTTQQRARFSAIRDKYLELATLIDELVCESKMRTKAKDMLAESSQWIRAAIEQTA